jgi:hypothetical protein
MRTTVTTVTCMTAVKGKNRDEVLIGHDKVERKVRNSLLPPATLNRNICSRLQPVDVHKSMERLLNPCMWCTTTEKHFRTNLFAHLTHTKTGMISGYVEDENVTEPVALLQKLKICLEIRIQSPTVCSLYKPVVEGKRLYSLRYTL